MDAELEALMKQLSDVQKQPSVGQASSREPGRALINERNAVDLVMKLIDGGYISLIFSSDGRSYVTPEKLRSEIDGELTLSGGRVNIVSLAHILNVDQPIIDENIDALLKSNRGYHLIGNELISNEYVTSAREEVINILSSSARGVARISELSSRFSLPEAFFVDHVLRDGSARSSPYTVNLDEGIVHNTSYIRWLKARICGALRSVTQPIRLSELAQRCEISDTMFAQLAAEVVRSRCVLGEVDTVRRLFIPEVYLKATRKWITSFYDQNGFVQLKTLVDLKYGKTPEEAIVKLLGDKKPILLSTVVVAPWKLDVAAVMINDAIVDEGAFINTSDVFPSSFSKGDVKAALTHCVEGLAKIAYVIDCDDASILIISKKIVSDALEYASKRVDINNNGNSRILNAYRNYSGSEEGDSGLGGDGAPAAKDGEDDDTGKKSKKGEKKKKKKGASAGEVSPKENFVKEVEALTSEFMKTKESSDSDEYVHAISGLIAQDIEAVCSEIVKKEKAAKLEESRSKSKELRSGLLALFVDALLASTAVETIELKESDKQLIKKHVQHTVLGDLVLGIAKAQAALLGVQVPPPKQGQDSLQQAVGVVALLPDQKLLQAIPGLAVADAPEPFFDACASALRSLGVREKLFDRARQHERLLQHEAAYAKALEPEVRPPAVLHTAVSLLFVRIFQSYLPFPPKFIHVFLDLVKAFVGEAGFATLVEFQKNVVLFIRSGGKSGLNPEVDEYFGAAIPAVKAIAVGKVTLCPRKEVHQKEGHQKHQGHHNQKQNDEEDDDDESNSRKEKKASKGGKKERHKLR